jgi:hypothetical protein
MSRLTPVAIAVVCHEANRALCEAQGDTSQVPWDQAPDWQKESAIKGVEFSLANPDAPASASHDSWLAEKERTGWKFGPVKDAEKKEHPCFVPYEQLPIGQQAKDHLFQGVVRALRGLAALALLLCLMPMQALAQSTTPESGGFLSGLLAGLLTEQTIGAAVGGILTFAAGWLVKLFTTSVRRRNVAVAIRHAYAAVEEIARLDTANNALDKAAAGLKAADQWMRANGWRPLTDAEQGVARLEFSALHGAEHANVRAITAAQVASAMAIQSQGGAALPQQPRAI